MYDTVSAQHAQYIVHALIFQQVLLCAGLQTTAGRPIEPQSGTQVLFGNKLRFPSCQGLRHKLLPCHINSWANRATSTHIDRIFAGERTVLRQGTVLRVSLRHQVYKRTSAPVVLAARLGRRVRHQRRDVPVLGGRVADIGSATHPRRQTGYQSRRMPSHCGWEKAAEDVATVCVDGPASG